MELYQVTFVQVPTAIAGRIDSDNQEIEQLLNDGGMLLYSHPQPWDTGRGLGLGNIPLPSDAESLVFGFIGCAQQNALLLNQLPPDLRRKVAMENALRLYPSTH